MTVELARTVFDLKKDDEVDMQKIIAVGKEMREVLKQKGLERKERISAETKLNACIVLYTGKELK